MNLGALILAGGTSSRMGRDKAWMEIAGRPLIERQVALVRQLGVSEVLISGRSGTDYTSLGCRVLHDSSPDAGPLAGIERGLAETSWPLLLVLAVDLPRMEARYLHRLAHACDRARGVVPVLQGRYEPLAAIFPKTAHGLARESLAAGQRAVHRFVDACKTAGLLHTCAVELAEEYLFLNYNSPEDLTADPGRPGTAS